MKISPSVKERCRNCYSHRIKGKLRIDCLNLKHKQRQG